MKLRRTAATLAVTLALVAPALPVAAADAQVPVSPYARGPDGVEERMDTMRLGLAGHSLGAGGALEMARDEPFFEATVALQPWDHAPVADMAEPFYESIPAEAEKAYVELAGADHAVGLRPDATQARLMVAWFKRYLDDDLRYDQFLCPPPAGPTIIEYRHTCPT